jgi:hypothetical protein
MEILLGKKEKKTVLGRVGSGRRYKTGGWKIGNDFLCYTLILPSIFKSSFDLIWIKKNIYDLTNKKKNYD